MFPAKFCIVPWVHLALFQGGHVTYCCARTSRFHFNTLTKENSLSELFNDPQMKELRKTFLDGKIPPHCQGCFQIEAKGGHSQRQKMNESFSYCSEVVNETEKDGFVSPGKLISLDLRFSNLCNFSCRMCGPHSSTGWYADSFFLGRDFGKQKLSSFASEQEFYKNLRPLLPQLETIYLVGGEPLLQKEHDLLLGELIAIKNTNVNLIYNSNFSSVTEKQIELWRHFPSVVIALSFDAAGKKGEYLRKGLHWNETMERLKRLRNSLPHLRFSLTPTISLYNVFSLVDLIEEVVGAGHLPYQEVYLNILNTPAFMNVCLLPNYLKEKVKTQIETFLKSLPEHDQKHLRREFAPLLEEMNLKLDVEVQKKMIEEFLKYNERLDLLRGEDFFSVFPEFQELKK